MDRYITGIVKEYKKILKENSILKKKAKKYYKRCDKLKKKIKKERNNDNKQVVKLLNELDVYKSLQIKLMEENKNLSRENSILYEDLDVVQSSNKKSIYKLKDIIQKLVSPRLLLDGTLKKEELIYEYQRGKCYYCDTDIKYENITIEHIIPKSVCKKNNIPPNIFENLRIVCNNCNQERGNKLNNKLFLNGIMKQLKNPTLYYPDALYETDCIVNNLYQSKNLLAHKILCSLEKE